MEMNGAKKSPGSESFCEMTGRVTGDSSREIFTRCHWEWQPV